MSQNNNDNQGTRKGSYIRKKKSSLDNDDDGTTFVQEAGVGIINSEEFACKVIFDDDDGQHTTNLLPLPKLTSSTQDHWNALFAGLNRHSQNRDDGTATAAPLPPKWPTMNNNSAQHTWITQNNTRASIGQRESSSNLLICQQLPNTNIVLPTTASRATSNGKQLSTLLTPFP
jgi:hypothetical protein